MNDESNIEAWWDESTLDERESLGLHEVLSRESNAELWWSDLSRDEQRAVIQALESHPQNPVNPR